VVRPGFLIVFFPFWLLKYHPFPQHGAFTRMDKIFFLFLGTPLVFRFFFFLFFYPASPPNRLIRFPPRFHWFLAASASSYLGLLEKPPETFLSPFIWFSPTFLFTSGSHLPFSNTPSLPQKVSPMFFFLPILA